VAGLPLAGIKVLDLTWNLPGPYASLHLAALGAEVTKVEPPKGDPARFVPALFETLNRGKASVRLDLATDADRARLAELIRGADVVLEGFRPGVAERLGCGPEQVRALAPRAIYCSITAFGRTGDRRSIPGHDLNAQAWAGVCDLHRDASDAPHGLPLPVADLGAAASAVASILAALYAREQDGRGRVLDVAMVDSALSWAATWATVNPADDARRALPRWLRPAAGPWLRRLERERLHAFPHYRTYPCGDGKWLAIGIVDEGHFWRRLCAELGLGPLARWPIPARVLAGRPIAYAIRRRLATGSRDAWVERLQRADLPVTPVLTVAEAVEAWRARAGADGGPRPPVAVDVS
jgi:CoA:oxalate CoA-transferase